MEILTAAEPAAMYTVYTNRSLQPMREDGLPALPVGEIGADRGGTHHDDLTQRRLGMCTRTPNTTPCSVTRDLRLPSFTRYESTFGDREGWRKLSLKLIADQADKFISGRQTPCLFLGVDPFAVYENIQCARCASTQSDWNTELTFDIVLEAHGLGFDIASKEAAFDLDTHS